MNKLGKRALPILIIICLLAMLLPIGVHAVVEVTSLSDYDASYGDEITVSGLGVTAGATVNVYWDLVQAWDGEAGLIASGKAKPAGNFDIDFDVPEAVAGDHYVWVKDTETGQTDRADTALTVWPYIKLTPSRGLANDPITIKGYGFIGEGYIESVLFGAYGAPSLSPTQPSTNAVGSWTATFKVPNYAYGSYTVTATDNETIGNVDTATFIIGASITITPNKGPTGTVVKIDGRGFLGTYLSSITLSAWLGVPVDLPLKSGAAVSTVAISNNKFSTEVVILDMGSKDDYNITVTDNATPTPTVANIEFELNGRPSIKMEPGYGAPGSTIAISGKNFTRISGKDVVVEMGTAPPIEIGTFKTTSEGTFSGTFTTPAGIDYGITTVVATDEYGVTDDQDFRIGVMIVIPVPSSGPSGRIVTLTATGFTNNMGWNATFGDMVLFEDMAVRSDGTISSTFYVPTVDPGTYTLSVLDIDTDITVTAEFTVTHKTVFTLDPPEAPNDYNVTIHGLYVAPLDTLDFTLYNATDEWDMDVNTTSTTADGTYYGLWTVPDNVTLGLGDYNINVTSTNLAVDTIFAYMTFSVVEERIEITTRKTEYAIGDTLSFVVKNDFKYVGSWVKIYDPDGDLYWQTDTFDTWLKVGTVYTVPFYSQTSGANPMVLTSEAGQGLWSWKFYKDADTVLATGEFTVGPSQAEVLNEQLATLSGDFDTLATTVSGLTQQVGTISATVTQLSTAVAQAAASAQQANAAVADLAETVSEIAGTANLAKTSADAAKTSADAARDSADQARTAATGLTTLVYGAIGASLVAALAAIVSLMQISRRIAG